MTATVVVYHSMYGCDTGCCGHTIEVTHDNGEVIETFEFDHPHEYPDNTPEAIAADPDFRKWAEQLVRSQGCDPADLDWKNCRISRE